MAVLEINWNPPPKQLRVFAALQLVFFLFVAWSISARTETPLGAGVVLGLSLLVAAMGLIRPKAILPVYVAWMAAVFPIGWCVSHSLLAILFYLVMTPVGIVMRCIGYDPLHRRLDRQAESYWIAKDPTKDMKRYFKQY